MADQELNINRNGLSSKQLDLQDDHVQASLGLFMIHNVVLRNLESCAKGATTAMDLKSAAAFLTYANYTLHFTQDQLESVDKIWFPAFARHDPDFNDQTQKHQPIYVEIDSLRGQLNKASKNGADWHDVAAGFEQLRDKLEPLYLEEEQLSNKLGHRVPLEEIRGLEAQQEKRRVGGTKSHGQLWSVVYLLRSLKPAEREIFPPGLPKIVASGMLTGGAFQYGK